TYPLSTQESKSLYSPTGKNKKNFFDNFMTTLTPKFFLNYREILMLNYCEYLHEEKFAIVSHASIDREDIPPKKGFIRATMGGGWIFRELSPNITHVVYCYYAEGGGSLTHLPKSVIRAVNLLGTFFNLEAIFLIQLNVVEIKKIGRLKKKFERAMEKGSINLRDSKSNETATT